MVVISNEDLFPIYFHIIISFALSHHLKANICAAYGCLAPTTTRTDD